LFVSLSHLPTQSQQPRASSKDSISVIITHCITHAFGNSQTYFKLQLGSTSSLYHTMVRHTKLPSKCFSPLSDPGNHGSDASMSLQVAPFQAEGNSIWIGYHAQPSRKYLGVFPSYEEVIDRCRRNAFAGRMNKSFPRFKTDARAEGGVVHHPDCPGSYLRHVCCAGCQVHGTDCERLTLEFLAVETPDDKDSTVFLLQYKFYLRGELMVALVHHFNHGKYSFQKTDGTLSKVLLMDSKHRCLNPSQLRDSEASSDTSSLTQFDCVEDEDEDEDAIIVRKQFRLSEPRPLTNTIGSRIASCIFAIQPTSSAPRTSSRSRKSSLANYIPAARITISATLSR
jgi:hypothetical protein